MCPNCRAFISSDDRVCPYCDVKLGPRAIERRTPGNIAGIIPGAQFITAIILLINIGLYIATMLFTMRVSDGGMPLDIHGQVLSVFGAKNTARISLLGEYWRLVTAGFLHGGLLHILMNSWALFSVGGQVEELFGSARFIVLYFVSTVCGFMLSTLWSPALSVGASAGIFGMSGAMIAFGMRHRGAMGEAVRSHYTQWAIYGIVMGLLPGFRVDNAAHIGGLFGGFAIAYFAEPKAFESWRDSVWKVLAAICLLLTALSFLAMFLRFTAMQQG